MALFARLNHGLDVSASTGKGATKPVQDSYRTCNRLSCIFHLTGGAFWLQYALTWRERPCLAAD
jgi:hypothetical protein